MRSIFLPILTLAANVAAQAENTYTATATDDVEKARATAKTLSPTSNVEGKAFNRLAIIWLENTDYDMAIGDRKSIPHRETWISSPRQNTAIDCYQQPT